MIPNFYIIGSKTERPNSRKTIFTDGSPDDTFRIDTDIELSHWIPNCTEEKYKADTSTEICMNFIVEESPDEWDLAINNHLDVDGILSVFTLVYSDFSIKNRDIIIEAAEMGDFWAWGNTDSQKLFQGLTYFMNELRIDKVDIQDIYSQCFNKTIALINNITSLDEDRIINIGLSALSDCINRVEGGQIVRNLYNQRFVHYSIPLELTLSNLDKAIKISRFNALIEDDLWLYSQVRNRLDKEKVQLVSVETNSGWYYDLWYPAYMWADTPNSWRAPGFEFTGSTNAYYYGYEPLNAIVKELNTIETADGSWILVKELTPFSSIKGRNYPVVLSYIGDTSQPLESKIPPREVSQLLSTVFK